MVRGHWALAGPLSRGIHLEGEFSKKLQLVIEGSTALTKAGKQTLHRAFEKIFRASGCPALKISLRSDLPVSMGLGSSAAVAVASARLLLQASSTPSTVQRVCRLAWEMEREFHGTPSGIDHTCSAYQALILYRRKSEQTVSTVRRVDSEKPLRLLVALTGPRSPARKSILELRERMGRWPIRYHRTMSEIGTLAREGAAAVTDGDWETLGDIMDANQGLLCALKLSSAPLDEMVQLMRSQGALGAKLTGAGGDGGAVIGLFREPEPVMASMVRRGITCFVGQIGGPQAL